MNTQQRKLIAAMSLCATIAIPNLASAAPISGQGTWETTLQGRDLDGNLSTFEAYYDTSLDITWLANESFGGTFGSVNAWAMSLNINGYTGWRLPITTDTGPLGCDYSETGGTDCGYNVDTASSEMAHMFHTTLGNKSYFDTSGNGPQAGWGLTNTGPFSNIQEDFYWSATDFAPPDEIIAWGFYFSGAQDYLDKSYIGNAWAVHSGDVGVAASTSAVPVPAAAWLFGSGLLGLIGVARRKAA